MEKTIVLLHPFPLSRLFWGQLKAIKGYQVVTPDFPGFGGTTPKPSGYTLAQAAKDLNEHLTQQFGPKPIVLGGISMGGYWAFEFLKQFPNRVEKLMLISTRAGADKAEGRQNRLKMAEFVEKAGVGHLPEAMIPGLLGKTTLADKLDVSEQVSKWILQASPAGVALAQRAMANRANQTGILAGIQAPTIIVAGKEDALIPTSESVAMQEAIPGSQLILMEKIGHLAPIEDPEKFQKLLEEFLAS